jgi:YD repeat-containing protein
MVNYATGGKNFEFLDYEQNIEFPLSFRRFYRTVWNNTVSPSWTFSYLQSLDEVNDGGPHLVIYNRADGGSPVTFRKQPNSPWLPYGPFGNNRREVLTREAGVFIITKRDGTVETFDSTDGRLLSVKNNVGLEHVVTYSANNDEVQVTTRGETLSIMVDTRVATAGLSYYPLSITTPEGKTFDYSYLGTPLKGFLTTVTFPDDDANTANNPFVQYEYDNSSFPYHITGITDEENNTLSTVTYDAAGRVMTSTLGNNNAEKVTLSNTAGTTRTVTNASGKQLIYSYVDLYGPGGKLALLCIEELGSSINCAQPMIHNGFDVTTGFLEFETNAEGMVTHNIYDEPTRLYKSVAGYQWAGGTNTGNAGDLVETSTMQSVESTKLADLVHVDEIAYRGKDVAGNWKDYQHVDFEYYANGRLQSKTVTDLTNYTTPYVTSGNTQVWTYIYTYHDPNDTIIATKTTDGPLAGAVDSSVETFDAQGRLISFVDALGHPTTYSAHNATGSPGTITGPNGEVTTLQYDAHNRVIDLRVGFNTPEETHTHIDYYRNGLVEKTTIALSTANEVWLRYEYNDARQLTKVENKAGETITVTPQALDGQWENLVVKDSNGAVKQQQNKAFDDIGRLEEVLDASGAVAREEFGYDLNGNVNSTTQGELTVTEVTRLYDTLDRLKQINHADSETSQYEYDEQGNLAKVTDQRTLVTTYQYDGLGNLMKVVSPDTGITTFTYDAAGNQTQQTDARGVVVNYQYDALSRLTNIVYPASSENVTYSYDSVADGNKGIGYLTGMSDPSGETSYKYDASGRMIQKIFGRMVWGYGYDLAGSLEMLTYPSGRTVRYTRDNVGRISAVFTRHWPDAPNEFLVANTFTYMPFGPLQSYKSASGVVHSTVFDTEYQVEDIQVGPDASPASIMDWTYDYFPTSNISSILDVNASTNDQDFTYDPESRLDTADGSYGALDYDYDGVGNREKLTIVDGGTEVKDYTYSSGSNQLESVVDTSGTTTLNYSASGQQTSGANYNDANRVKSVGGASYAYNGLGQRVMRQGSIGGEYLHNYSHYSNNGQLLAEYTRFDALVAEYIYADGMLLTTIKPDSDSDTDNDGIDDDWEILHVGDIVTLNEYTDSDGDGMLDIDEFSLGYNPTNQNDQVDSDNDGLSDLWELMYFHDLDQDQYTDFNNDGELDIEEFQNITDPTELSQAAWLIPVYGMMQ